MLQREVKAAFNCDSVEISPRHDNVFVGMYEYDESSSNRGGGFLILNGQGEIKKEFNADFGCLDAKWLDEDRITIACSDGIIREYAMHADKLESETPVVDEPSSRITANILMTIDTNDRFTAVISAKGELALCEQGIMKSKWVAHSPVLESWCCALRPSGNMVVTGSDDCSLKYWDIGTGELIHHDKKNHTLGTTCIEFLNDHQMLSGSYDERIRLFDIRRLDLPLEEAKSIGGIWRLKASYDKLYVAACYGGCQVLNLNTLQPIVEEYANHKSMAYGIHPSGPNSAVSCSFYDRSIQYWSF